MRVTDQIKVLDISCKSRPAMGSSPGDSDFFSYYEFFLSLSFLPVDSDKDVCTERERGG